MNLGSVMKAFDALMALRDTARRLKGGQSDPTAMTAPTASGLGGQIEARLTGVVVAALKEAFDRDHARLELERAQLDEQRRRAEESLKLELQRQAAERELARLRLLAATALIGWIVSLVLIAVRAGTITLAAQVVSGAGCLLILAALGTAFAAQSAITVQAGRGASAVSATTLWLLLAGFALTAIGLLV